MGLGRPEGKKNCPGKSKVHCLRQINLRSITRNSAFQPVCKKLRSQTDSIGVPGVTGGDVTGCKQNGYCTLNRYGSNPHRRLFFLPSTYLLISLLLLAGTCDGAGFLEVLQTLGQPGRHIQTSLVEQVGHSIRGLGTLVQPVQNTVDVQVQSVWIIVLQQRVVRAHVLDEAPISCHTRISNDQTIERSLLPTISCHTNLSRHKHAELQVIILGLGNVGDIILNPLNVSSGILRALQGSHHASGLGNAQRLTVGSVRSVRLGG
mmetsp:Transcript_8738/g.16732  ORF Transcript_8738/g.16732 Transcript_8738/m.16732 type:complete len:262 (+) Transcript_8738:359-1144(+)